MSMSISLSGTSLFAIDQIGHVVIRIQTLGSILRFFEVPWIGKVAEIWLEVEAFDVGRMICEVLMFDKMGLVVFEQLASRANGLHSWHSFSTETVENPLCWNNGVVTISFGSVRTFKNALPLRHHHLETTDKVVLIKEKLKAARDYQKSYADNRRKLLEFEVGDHMLLKVSPWEGVIRFGKRGKLALRTRFPKGGDTVTTMT
ncbi:hypothetical protein Tco_0190088 [Tanacetum coccineum]